MRETCLAAARWPVLWTFLVAASSPLLGAEKTVTRQEAQTLPVSQLADRMLGASAAPYSEVERPGEPSGPFAGHDPELQSLRFATTPRWSGLYGLCFADTVFLTLVRPNDIEPPHRNSPMVVQGISTAQAYRFIGPPERGRPSSASDDSTQEEACRRAGPVFHPPGTHFGARFFYGKNDYTDDLPAVHAYFAGWALETAQHALAEGGSVALTCAEDPSEPKGRLCAEPSSLFRQLQLADVSFVALERCKGDPSTFCAEITFTRPGGTEDKEKVWRIGLTTDATRLQPLPKTLEVRRVAMEAWTVVE
ncbi:MAG: hypothetical protein ACJ8ER_08350 [Allosphingosinicella sp.]